MLNHLIYESLFAAVLYGHMAACMAEGFQMASVLNGITVNIRVNDQLHIKKQKVAGTAESYQKSLLSYSTGNPSLWLLEWKLMERT